MEQENQVETVETQNTQAEETVAKVETTESQEQPKKSNVTEVVRELSKTFSVNLFDENGLVMLKEKLDKQNSSFTELNTKVEEAQKNAQLFEQKEQDYQFKISALGEGFKSESLDEVLALAKINVGENETIADGLKKVKEKYGSVFMTTKQAGIVHNDSKGEKPDLAKTEQEKFMNDNAKYRNYYKK